MLGTGGDGIRAEVQRGAINLERLRGIADILNSRRLVRSSCCRRCEHRAITDRRCRDIEREEHIHIHIT